ncbi:MAG TPA: hypothetical protein VF119_00230 [Candidatus Limnocylindrales bacterium]
MTEEERPAPPRKPKKQGGGLTGETLGGMLAGFDQAIFRTTPPPHELVLKGSPVRGLSGDPGEGGDHDLIITLPVRDDPPDEPPGGSETTDTTVDVEPPPASEAPGAPIDEP